MAPKRSAPPAPALVQSSSSADESEEEIAQSPPAATRNKAPRRQKGEADEEQEEAEEVEEEAEEQVEETEAEEEDEEEDEEAPESKSARKRKAKKPADPFQRSWSKDDDIRILEVLAAYRREHNKLPKAEDIEADLAGKLDTDNHDRKGLGAKLKSLKAMYGKNVKNGVRPSNDTERQAFNLSKEIWGVIGKPKKGAAPVDFRKICDSFPCLAEMMKKLDREEPDLFKREFSLVDPAKARVLEQKIKKQSVEKIKLGLREQKLTTEVTKALLDLIE